MVNGHDADPALVVADFLISPQYGVGFPAASLAAPTGTSGDASYQSWCRTAGLAISPCLSDSESAATILARWLTLTGATAIWSGGLLRLVPFADAPVTGTLADGTIWSFVPAVTPVMDLADDDFVHEPDADPVLVTRSDPYAASNVQRLEMLDRGNAYSADAGRGARPERHRPLRPPARLHRDGARDLRPDRRGDQRAADPRARPLRAQQLRLPP